MRSPSPVSSSFTAAVPRARAILCAAALLLSATPAAAQTAEASSPVIYRLDAGATYQTGCFDPCLCPIMLEAATRGTFILTPDGFDGDFARYQVSDVNWTVAQGDPELRVTGSGLFWAGGEMGSEQRLQLELSVAGAPAEKFDSGWVKGAAFPAIQATISIHGIFCYDTVFKVAASPVPPEEVVVYRVLAESTFQRGCVGLCDCLLEEPRQVRGRFLLVPLEENWLFSEFAVVNVRWSVEPIEGTTLESLPIRGSGTYWVGGEFAVTQRLRLDLEVGSDPLAPYDSGKVAGGGSFPRIDIRVANGDPLCYQTVIDLHARPRAQRRLRSR
jgi:hypothetical protein